MIFFFWVTIKSIKNKNLVHLTLLNHSIKRCCRFLKHKFLFLDDQYFYFSICRPLNWRLLLSIIILSTDRPEIIFPAARTTKNQVAFALVEKILLTFTKQFLVYLPNFCDRISEFH